MAAQADTGSGRAPDRKRTVGVVAAVVAVALFAGWVLFAGRGGGSEHRFVIPAGTGQRLDAGETIEIIPRQLGLRVADRLVIRNDDDRVHVVGPFTVRAGETLIKTFNEPGSFVGECSVHPSGRISIDVT